MTTIDISHSLSLKILLGDPPGSISAYHYSYHGGDAIHGSISIRSEADLQFETLEIFFVGEEQTTRSGNNKRQFHNEQYQIPESTFPPGKLIKKHQRYLFHFHFQVPNRLAESTCQHPVTNALVRETHLQPPPSFGVPDIAGFGGKLRNDYAPTNCRILYTIQTRLTRRSLVTEMLQPILQRSLKIRLKPSSSSAAQALIAPPTPTSIDREPLALGGPQSTIDIYQREPSQSISTSISTSKSKSKSKSEPKLLGRLTTTINVPPRFDVPVRETDASVRQAIRLNLIYEKEPEKNPLDFIQHDDGNQDQSLSISKSKSPTQPTLPQIQSLRGSVVANTFYTKQYHTSQPSKQKDRLGTKLNYAEKILTEFTHAITSPQWVSVRHDSESEYPIPYETPTSPGPGPGTGTGTGPGELELAQSLSPSSSSSSCSASSSSTFSMTLLVPVKLSHQFIIPTFHSCRMSRTYTLVLRLKVAGAETVKIVCPMVIAPSDDFDRPPPYSEGFSVPYQE